MTSSSVVRKSLWRKSWCWWVWLILVSLWRCGVHAAHSLSVLDSRLSSYYQKNSVRDHPPYDVFEPGFAADPTGYELRNAFQSHHPAAAAAAEHIFKTGPGKNHEHDDGYNTRTAPLYPNHQHYDGGGYATQNAFYAPHHYPEQHNYPPAHDGYHTKTAGYNTKTIGGYNTKTVGFPVYQDYQHPYHADPGRYATRNAFSHHHHSYRSAEKNADEATTIGPSKQHLPDAEYRTRTAAEWIPLYQEVYLPPDPGGYATQNAYATQNVYRPPYRSSVKVSGYERKTPNGDGHFEDYKAEDEGEVSYRQVYYSNDDDDDAKEKKYHNYNSDDDDEDGDGVLINDRSAPRAKPTARTNSFVRTPTQVNDISTDGGWRSAVGPRPNIHVDVNLPTSLSSSSSSSSSAAAGYSSFDITIDRFGQEEDVTGLSFAEPIGYHPSRSLSKQSESAPRLDNSFDKRQVAEHGQRSYKLDPCVALPDGDYPLDERFHGLLPGVNSRCNFIKCAHHTTFVNACSEGTRNPDYQLSVSLPADQQMTGAHYCSVRDVDNQCHQQYYHFGDDQKLHADVKHYYSA